MTYSLEDLFPPDVLQPRVQVLDPRLDILKLILIGALNHTTFADSHVQGQFDAAVRVGRAQPARLAALGLGSEADLVVARVGSCEGEAARRRTFLGNDTVVTVEDLLGRGSVDVPGEGVHHRSENGRRLTSTEM